MYSSAKAIRLAGGAPELRAFHRSISRKASVIYAFYRTEVLTANPSYPSRAIVDLMNYAWTNALVP